MNISLYVASAAAIAQIMGVFLGLYFTAIGVVVGGVYSRVSSDVRGLMVGERVGDRYLKLVALTGIYALYLSALASSGFSASRSGYVILFVITTYAVFGFTQLGLRVYHLLDPERLAARLNLDVSKAMGHLRLASSHARDPSFQAYYREQVESALGTYDSLYTLVVSSPPNLDASKDLLLGQITVWWIYTHMKAEIPAASGWYRPRYEFSSVLAADDSTMVTIHLATATLPPPAVAPDHLWFDRAVAESVAKKLALHLELSDLLRSVVILQVLQQRIHDATEGLAIEEAFLLERVVSEGISKQVAQLAERKAGKEPGSKEEVALVTQLCDFLALVPMQVLLGCAERLRAFKPDTLIDIDHWPQWYLKRRFYGYRLPRAVLVRLEDVTSRLAFEELVEGTVLTESWYLRQQFAVVVIDHVMGFLPDIVGLIERRYLPLVQLLQSVGATFPATHVAFRALEACEKLRRHLPEIVLWGERMRSLHVISAEAATLPDVDTLVARVESVEERMQDILGTLAFDLYEPEAKLVRDLPDYFGQAYMTVATETFDRLQMGNAKAEGLFRVFFALSILASQRLQSELEHVQDISVKVRYLTEPLIQLMELSGYAYLFSQLRGNGVVWRAVRGIWDKQLGSTLNPELVRIVAEDRDVGRPWYTQRFNWQRAFREDLDSALSENRWLSAFIKGAAEYIFGGHGLIDLDARAAFVIVYLREHPSLPGLQLSPNARSLQHNLDRANL